MIRAVIIADDLTGAMDTDVHFAAQGFSTQVMTELPEKKCGQEAESEPLFTGNRWLLSDAEVALAKLAGRRATKFASAMHDGKWHHIVVTFDPERKEKEYALDLLAY